MRKLRLLSIGGLAGLIASLFVVAGTVGVNATPPGPDGHKVYICHRDGQSGKYNLIDVDIASSGYLQGGHQDAGHQDGMDIIPPYDYTSPDGQTKFHYDGLNWPKYEAIWNNDCNPVTPSLATATDPPTAVIGTVLNDTATLTGGAAPTGTIKFQLFRPGETTAVDTESVSVNGDGDYTTPNGFQADKLGTWYWVASYGGDTNNRAVATGATDEPVTVTKATPGITTTPSAGGVVGTTITDTATLTGGYGTLTGSITFKLYDPNGHLAFTSDPVTVDGAGTYPAASGFAADEAGTWHWVAEYSGDNFNMAVASNAADEPVTITAPEQPNKVTPGITTTANPSSGNVGAVLKDTAHLTGGNNPTGTLTFTLYKPDGSVAYQEQATVSGAKDYSTANGFTSNAAGTWHWVASYGGDSNNNAVASGANDEPVVITAAATPTPTPTGATPTPTPTGAVSGEALAATGSQNWLFDLGLCLVALGVIASAISFGVIRVGRSES